MATTNTTAKKKDLQLPDTFKPIDTTKTPDVSTTGWQPPKVNIPTPTPTLSPTPTSTRDTRSYDQVVHDSPLGQHDTVIYNSKTGQYKIQTDLGNSQISERDTKGNSLYKGSSGSDTRAILAKQDIQTVQNAEQYAKDNPPIKDASGLNLDQLNPEQQAIANSTLPSSNVSALQLARDEALRQGAIGAAGGTVAGIASIPVTGGLGIPVGAGLGALGGEIKGAINGLQQAKEINAMQTVDTIDSQFRNSKMLLEKSITLLNKGGNDAIAIEGFKTAEAQFQQIENSYKAEETRNRLAWKTDIKSKQDELKFYREQILPLRQQAFIMAYQKPNPAYIGENNG